MRMRTILSCAALVVMSAALPVATAGPSAAAQAHAAVKAPLIHNPLNNCELGAGAIPGSGTPTSSFALIVHVWQGVRATVVLRHARPDATYTVYLIQSEGVPGNPMDCSIPDATLTTNNSGTGVAVTSESLLPAAAYVHVYLYTLQGGFDYFDTDLVPVS